MMNPNYKDPKELKDDPRIWLEPQIYNKSNDKTNPFQSFDEVEDYLYAIPQEKWNKLFELIPRMESAESYTIPREKDYDSPYSNHNQLYFDFYQLFYDTDLNIEFYWAYWEYGSTIENDLEILKNERFAHLAMLLTAFVRSDRYNEGVLHIQLEEKFVLNILKAIKFKLRKNI